MKKLSIIVSIANNNVIGKNNALLWKQSDDLKRFKEITTGHHIIMGQKTYESIGKLLPNRTTIIISNDPEFKAPYGAYVARSIEHSLDVVEYYSTMYTRKEQEIFIVGGGSIYKQFLPYATKLYLTRINVDIEGDTYFPNISEDEWSIISKETHEKDEKNEYDYTFEVYERT